MDNLHNWLFAVPLWVLTLLAVAAVGLLVSGNNRQDKRLMLAGLAVLLLGIGWGLLSHFVDTPTETVVKRTRLLAQAIDNREWDTFRDLLHPNTGFAIYHNREQLVEGAARTADAIGLRSVAITGIETQHTGSLITVDLSARSEQDAFGGRPALTSWRLEWHQIGDDWLLLNITALPNQFIRPDQIHGQLRRAN